MNFEVKKVKVRYDPETTSENPKPQNLNPETKKQDPIKAKAINATKDKLNTAP